MPGRRTARRVPILMYHQLSPRPVESFRRWTVAPRAFAAQMRWLAQAGYETVGLDALARHRTDGAPLPPRAVVITFDDGYREGMEHALPVLRAWGFTATFFLVAGLMGDTSHWTRAPHGFELPLIGWGAARELQAAGFACGAHTVTHPRLAELPDAVCREELQRSRWLLENALGRAVVHVAYPFGSYDERVRRMAAEAGYRTACSMRADLSRPHDDLLALPRVEVSGFDSLTDFIFRLRTARTPGEVLRHAARALLRRRASRPAAARTARR
ncbi:MAG: polysaccharide deacetylase family protein [Gemmatimonadaceae bacterium]